MALMRKPLTWLVGGAVVLLLVVAVADAIRSRADASSSPAPTPRILHGVILAADAACQTQAFRLPSMASEQPRHPPDCNGLVWSQDGSLVARCKGDFTSMTSSDGIRFPNVDGCAPAWRADGALSVIFDGNIVVVRRHGDPFIFFSRPQLTDALRAAGVENAAEWRFAQVGWFGLTSFVAVVEEPTGEAAIAVSARGGLESFLPEPGARIEDLRASPLGNFGFALAHPEREYVMVSRGGDPIAIPHVRGAEAIAWSPDERYVAIATDDETVIGRTGTTSVVTTLPFGARALAWLT
jgi:hypothetical protein